MKFRDRVSVLVLHENRVLAFHAEDPNNSKEYVFLPGGAREQGETSAQTAIRETLEETGYSIDVIGGIEVNRRYIFPWNGELFDTQTLFLAGRLKSSKAVEVHDAEYHRGVVWIPAAKIEKVFSYHAEILEAVQTIMIQLRQI